jgi:hypothetical protein
MENKLPKLKDLTSDIQVAYKGDQLNLLLNQEPKPEWIKEHPFVKGHKYVPIGIIEMLLRRIFKQYKVEITGQGTAFNGVWCTVRVHYLSPVTNEWSYHDGIGAIHLQVKSGSSPADLANINNGALSMAFPHAESLAIKDACDKFGKLFGADLNRRDTLSFQVDETLSGKKVMTDKDFERAKDSIKNKQASLKRISELWQMTTDQYYELEKLAIEVLGNA